MTVMPGQESDESARAYAAFVAYCELGPERSLQSVAQRLRKSKTLCARWSTRHDWQERAAVYDQAILSERAEVLQAARKADIERLRVKSMEDAATLRTLARALILKLGRRIGSLDEDKIAPATLGTLLRALAATLDTATNLEASALGIEETHSRVDTDGS